jgi:hypothetical protein
MAVYSYRREIILKNRKEMEVDWIHMAQDGFELRNVLSVSVECQKIFNRLSEYQLLADGPVPGSLLFHGDISAADTW